MFSYSWRETHPEDSKWSTEKQCVCSPCSQWQSDWNPIELHLNVFPTAQEWWLTSSTKKGVKQQPICFNVMSIYSVVSYACPLGYLYCKINLLWLSLTSIHTCTLWAFLCDSMATERRDRHLQSQPLDVWLYLLSPWGPCCRQLFRIELLSGRLVNIAQDLTKLHCILITTLPM